MNLAAFAVHDRAANIVASAAVRSVCLFILDSTAKIGFTLISPRP